MDSLRVAVVGAVPSGFYAAAYVRAWILEAQMRRYLQRDYDDQWFRNPKAGKFLIELWREHLEQLGVKLKSPLDPRQRGARL